MARRPKAELNPPKYASERHDLILQRARRDGRVDVAVLAKDFDVTTETIRRDLVTLEQHGLVERVHGGALLAERRHAVPNLSIRIAAMAEEKGAIARAALQEMPLEGSVILDAGSSTLRLAEMFPEDRSLTVVTNSIQIASVLVRNSRLTVYTVGGGINRGTLSEVGSWALHALSTVYADVAFLGTYGYSVERGCSATNDAEAMVKRAIVESSERVVVLADHTKLGVNHFANFAPPGTVDLLITDERADPEYVKAITASGQAVRVGRL